MAPTDPRNQISQALGAFLVKNLKDASRAFLATLGYSSQRYRPEVLSTPQAFIELFAGGEKKLDEAKALVSEWKTADLLFQLTDHEICTEATLFPENEIQKSLLQSYLFFAIELAGSEYARGKLAGIARQINRLFSIPVMLLIKHGDKLTIAVINRRQNKNDESKDVLGKVTLISNIHLASPHRGHLDILDSLAFENLEHPQKLPINNFDTLHAAWEQIFNVELLNKRFYRELSNWYFWALPKVEFPSDIEADDGKRRATGLIRLLTRLIFCWFLKEKDLIPAKLFHPTDLEKILKGFDPKGETSSTYYWAILQNLFFATLNQRMGKDSKGVPYRTFVPDQGFNKNKTNHNLTNSYRYEKLFAGSQADALALFENIPFLNGGLFECLDKRDEENKETLYLDGFSRIEKKRSRIPDSLFFGCAETADLSAAYGEKVPRPEKVSGLIHILDRYKFTIEENTPIEQEIALDPELLGKVFENLLASYNDETKTTARKQTGSFYTPRPIVEYMVDESLKAHLTGVAPTLLSGNKAVAPTLLSGNKSEQPPRQECRSYDPTAGTHKTAHNLPHWTQDGTTYWVTFRLADSLPQEKLTQWKRERDLWVSAHPQPWSDANWDEYHQQFDERFEQWLADGMGKCPLRRPEIRNLLKESLLHFDGVRYDLCHWVIMPNHAHLLIQPRAGYTLASILQGIKGVSSKNINALLEQTGKSLWQKESYDHIVRSQAQYNRLIAYMDENPIKAKLSMDEFSIHKRTSDNERSSDTPVGEQSRSSDTPVGEQSRSSDTPVGEQKRTATATGVSQLRSRLDHLFSYTEEPHQFSDSEVSALIAAIDSIKILDPACGSGAFPMGILHKLVYILGKLDPDNAKWKQTQLNKLDSAPMREELEKIFADNNDDYGRKLYLIENCLYGVDIQPIAIQISKLRFFISLICDQRTSKDRSADNERSSDTPVGAESSSDTPDGDRNQTATATGVSQLRPDNHGIRPLPNLETKFVAANTLIGLPATNSTEGLLNLTDSAIEKLRNELQNGRHRYFTAQNRTEKLRIQKADKELREKLTVQLANSFANDSVTINKLATWDPFDPQASADFFDPEWMFGIKNGFDIVIGNPPYVLLQSANKDKELDKYFRKNFKVALFKLDLYHLFVEKGVRLLSRDGTISYIIPSNFVSNNYAVPLRKFFLTDTWLEKLIFFAEDVFAACVHNLVFVAHHSGHSASDTCFSQARFNGERIEIEQTYNAKQNDLINEKSLLIPRHNLSSDAVIERMNNTGQNLGAVASVNFGMQLRDRRVHGDDVIENPKDIKSLSTFYRECYSGRDIRRFQVTYSNRYCYFNREAKRGGCWDAGIHSAKGKILIRQIGAYPEGGLDTHGFAVLNAAFMILPKSICFTSRFLLGILNSRCIRFYWENKFQDTRKTFPKIKGEYLKLLPIPAVDMTKQTEIALLGDRILAAKQKNPTADTTTLESEIDRLVYALYGLTAEEIAIVEGQK